MSANKEEEFQYEDRYVAFLDVLGWSEATALSVDDEGARARIWRAVRAVAAFVEDKARETAESGYHQARPRLTQFSDSLVLSLPYSKTSMEWVEPALLSLCSNVARAVLECGFLVRGGI